jgi:hypothetical protein
LNEGLLARLDVTVRAGSALRSRDGVSVHRSHDFGPDPPVVARRGLAVTHPVRLGDRTVYLDVDAERERVGFELDGAAFHGDPEQREADLCRDAALAALGIQVVRFSHRRLVREPGAVRREGAGRSRLPAAVKDSTRG